MRITTLTAADAPAYRDLMLEAYTQAADAFTSTAQERAAEPLSWWERRIASADGLSESFGAFQEQQLVGTVALEYSAKPKTCHSVLVIGMYLRPLVRRQGIGTQLMRAAIAAARARPQVCVLRLTVTEGNESALRLYNAVGFSAWGTEPHAIRTPTGFKGKVHMSLLLDAERAAALHLSRAVP
jgi:RimJ/RimL family protein N-acetyltransferase